MTEKQFLEALLAHVAEGWAELPANQEDPNYAPLTLEGNVFETSQLGDLGAWGRLSVLHTTSQQTTQGAVGDRKYERRGVILVQLFGPATNKGKGIVVGLADDITSVMQGVPLGDLHLFEATPVDLDEEPNWSTKGVRVRFRYTNLG